MRKASFFCLVAAYGVAMPFFSIFAGAVDFSAMLRRGSRGAEVRMLQEFLKRDPGIYPEGLVTGYFGARTETAIRRFQKQYGIAPIGIVGPQTRKKLNELLRMIFPPSASSALPVIREMRREVSAPAPLRVAGFAQSPAVPVTPDGVFEGTNRERVKNNLPALAKNITLDAIADAKLRDMFLRQYFAHESPSGKRAGDLAKDAGYEFVNIGENLALGDFENDEALVQAWMNSPGHRANILGQRFTEIGIAAARNIFEGRNTWLAVQTFARPFLACPAPDSSLRASIEEKQKRIGDLSALAEIKKGELDAIPQSETERYNAKVEDYNAVTTEGNTLIEEIKAGAEQYNTQVSAFNACVAAPAF